MSEILPPSPRAENDFSVYLETDPEIRTIRTASDRLSFDGYNLTWTSGSAETVYAGFSGQEDESARESEKDRGPIPQGEYVIDPNNIEKFAKDEAWGSNRVKIEPLKATVDRMVSCFKVVRSGMYVHGGDKPGTVGCIELNDDGEEKAFFEKLQKYGKKIQLIVKYVGARETKYEEPNCPYG